MIREWFPKSAALTAYVLILGLSMQVSMGQVSRAPTDETQPSRPMFLSFSRFKIPFNLESSEGDIRRVQLWVSTDEGKTWQMHGEAKPEDRHFDFNAAAEGLYLFSVQVIDKEGVAYPSPSPPMKVLVDTSKPETAIRADINGSGQLVIDVRVRDENLAEQTLNLRMRTDRDPSWQSIDLGALELRGDIYQGQAVAYLPACREVALVLTVSDQADNLGEASHKYVMPRTAAGDREMQLASSSAGSPPATGGQQSHIPDIPGAVGWNAVPNPNLRSNGAGQLANGAGQLVGSGNQLSLEPAHGNPQSAVEELPSPAPVGENTFGAGPQGYNEYPVARRDTGDPKSQAPAVNPDDFGDQPSIESGVGKAFHCKSRAFNLDYSVEALGGSSLAEVELWGTEDGGRTWQQWGADPDRVSPFDVQVGNDGLFGFRMVIVGTNGVVSNRPKDGDSADVWINIDSTVPSAKISRAVYGEGPEDGMLVIDYSCQDGHLVDRPITLSYSETAEGPGTIIASGLENTGIYLWKADPNLPQRIYLRLEVVDKAGNIGKHHLDLPIDTKGLGPRGKIQGFRPILDPS